MIDREQAKADVYTDPKYPGYGIIRLGDEVIIPVTLREGEILDGFTKGEGAVSAFYAEDEAWAFIAQDYAVMHA